MSDRYKKRINWGVEETRLLIHLWGDPDMQSKFKKFARKDSLYKELEAKMLKNNHARSWHQIKEKVRNLKRYYRMTLRANSLNGVGHSSTDDNPFFDDMDLVMGGRPCTDPLDISATSPVPSTFGSITPTEDRVKEDTFQSDTDEMPNESSSSRDNLPPPDKRSKKDGLKTLESLIQGFAERSAVYLEQQRQILKDLKELKDKEEAWRFKEQEYREKEAERLAREEERYRRDEERKDKMLELMAMLVANASAEKKNTRSKRK